MREIQSLYVMCLRAVGSQSCSAEDTFAPDQNGRPSSASRLLRSFHRRGTKQRHSTAPGQTQGVVVPLERTPCIGEGSARRFAANEIDLHHPITACRYYQNTTDDTTVATAATDTVLVMCHGSPALDVLQAYVDSLVELGRMDDRRLGVHFLEEYRINIQLSSSSSNEDAAAATETNDTEGSLALTSSQPPVEVVSTPLAKRRRTLNNKKKKSLPTPALLHTPSTNIAKLGSFSLYNCTVSEDTFDAFQRSDLGSHLAILDLTGVRGLTDSILAKILPSCALSLRALSIKNCRRISKQSIPVLQQLQQLTFLDVGGAFNLAARDILDLVPCLPHLDQLHASGLGWTDALLSELVLRNTWTALSLNFSLRLSQNALKQNLVALASSLRSLALAFCHDRHYENGKNLVNAVPCIDNAALAMLGRNLPNVTSLDVRGNHHLSTITGWYDGRVSADLLTPQPLVVLARFSSITQASVDETKRVHPREAAELTVILGGGGMGAGITRVLDVDG